jgi:hypothetical protein
MIIFQKTTKFSNSKTTERTLSKIHHHHRIFNLRNKKTPQDICTKIFSSRFIRDLAAMDFSLRFG